jgi:hypothetical protein
MGSSIVGAISMTIGFPNKLDTVKIAPKAASNKIPEKNAITVVLELSRRNW